MSEQEKKDVTGAPSTPEGQPSGVSNPPAGQDDKDKNFAALRAQLDEANRKLAALSGAGKPEEGERPKPTATHLTDAEKVVFDRDLRTAIKQWRGKNGKVTAEQWAQIQKTVVFAGDELADEIVQKIDAAYTNLPGVREAREKAIREQGRREAMGEFSDDDMDGGSFGGDAPGAGGEPEARFTDKEKRWLDGFGVKQDDRKKINKRSTEFSNWQVLDKRR